MERKNYPTRANDGHKYEPVSTSEQEARDHHRHHSIEDSAALGLSLHLKDFKQENRKRAVLAMTVIGALLFLYWAIA